MTTAGSFAEMIPSTVHAGYVASATSTTITFNADASGTTNLYNPALITITRGTGRGQTRSIIRYDGVTRTAIVDEEWIVVPDSTSRYEVHQRVGRILVDGGMAQAGSARSITLASYASAADDIYTDQSIVLRGGTGTRQSRRIVGYVGSTRVATVAPAWNTVPDATSIYEILPLSTSGDVWSREGNFGSAQGQVSLNNATEKTIRDVGDLSDVFIYKLESCLLHIIRQSQSNITIRVKADINGTLRTLWFKTYSAESTTRNILEENGEDPVAPTARGLAGRRIVVTAQGDIGSPATPGTVDFNVEVSRAS